MHAQSRSTIQQDTGSSPADATACRRIGLDPGRASDTHTCSSAQEKELKLTAEVMSVLHAAAGTILLDFAEHVPSHRRSAHSYNSCSDAEISELDGIHRCSMPSDASAASIRGEVAEHKSQVSSLERARMRARAQRCHGHMAGIAEMMRTNTKSVVAQTQDLIAMYQEIAEHLIHCEKLKHAFNDNLKNAATGSASDSVCASTSAHSCLGADAEESCK